MRTIKSQEIRILHIILAEKKNPFGLRFGRVSVECWVPLESSETFLSLLHGDLLSTPAQKGDGSL